MKVWLVFWIAALACWGQTAELTPAWDISKTLNALAAQTQRLTPVLEQLKPDDWVSRGAPEGYIQQTAEIRRQIAYVRQTAAELSAEPGVMTRTLEVFLRLQSLESMLDSLSQGVRQYQNPALADLLQSIVSENNANRARLREYLIELVSTKEVELRIADLEAQRCRATLIRKQRAAPK
jgi:hypothetical protein